MPRVSLHKPSLVFAVGAVLFSSCSELLKVPTIQPKVKNRSQYSEAGGETGLGGIGGVPGARISKPDEGIQTGIAPDAVGFLPSKVGEGVMAGDQELYSDQSIIWSDEDNPNADIPFEKAFVKRKAPVWFTNYRAARRESMRSGKPVLMWFMSDGAKPDPKGKTLRREVFAKTDFGEWAKENIIRLKIDVSGASMERGELSSATVKARKAAEALQKRFQAKGLPTVVLLEPGGAVYTRLRGYKVGSKKEYWGRLKDAVLTIQHNHTIWKQKMARKGYREWTGKKVDQKVFAKLVRFKDGRMTLVEPDGNRVRTTTKNISKKDRAYIIAEKEKRGL